MVTVKSNIKARAPPEPRPARSLPPGARAHHQQHSDPDDVIDLGAPRPRASAPRTRARPYTPNPRLYPGPRPAPPAPHRRRAPRAPLYRRPLPNSRLYRPPASRAPPPAHPRVLWSPAAGVALLDTASRAALRLAERRRPPVAPRPKRARRRRRVAPSSRTSTPPAARPRPGIMADDALTAPSEFLAEFLSSIMRREYGEALKYCRLILQYEPHNETARSFHPLLMRKLALARASDDETSSSTGSSRSHSPRVPTPDDNGNTDDPSPARDDNDNLPHAIDSDADATPTESLRSLSARSSLARLRAHFACSIK